MAAGRRIGDLPFEAIRAHVDEIVTVSEQAILDATRLLLTVARVVAEPSGAVSVAAALSRPPGERVVAVISGGNIDQVLLQSGSSRPARPG